MEPITTAVLVSGLVQLGKTALGKAAETVGDEAAKKAVAYWPRVKSLLGFTADPAPEKLDDEIRQAVDSKPEVHEPLGRLLDKVHEEAPELVGSIHIGKGIANVIRHSNAPININMTFDKE
jgi:hypothetical protein